MPKLLDKILKRNRKLGVGERKGRYDLPLAQSSGNHFLMLLVGLMTFLALMAISATMVLGGITSHWSSGLENKLTVEIPAARKGGTIRKTAEVAALSDNVEKVLKTDPNIKSYDVLTRAEINDLISPWLGDDVVLDDIPLPGLISVELQIRDKGRLENLQKRIEGVADDIRLDTHEGWLEDIIRLAGSLKLSAGFITLIIIITTVTAIAGAVRSRMAEHKADIELLHLMGASDLYITRQLQRHAATLTLKGSIGGLVIGGTILFLILLISGGSAQGLLPNFSLSGMQITVLLLLPVAIGVIAAQTARFTVLRVLGQMP